ncbi:uncharacterized protein [Spinacia oleracea]|uniref:Retrotransposon Copia-like N-terminal domain-containing protein n=1 Tax=Spinacia oleracea TaxID=3562 RepID=A0ABM3QJG2_SPIOL|nr:uncharacterized protein LOC130459898 [Spinacia oleracea]
MGDEEVVDNRVLEPTQDPSTVYYIHPSDNNNHKFISEIFDGENYSSWKRSMIIGLSTKNKMSFVDGTLPMPLTTDVTYKAWIRCNNLVIGWILGVLGPITKKSVFFYKTAREMWMDLEERYGQVSSTELYGIQEEISAVHQENEEIAEFFARIKVLWDQLDDVNPIPVCTCSGCVCNVTGKFVKIQQDYRLLQFLMKLKDEYKQVRSNVLMMQPLPTLTLAYRMLLQEQKHKQISEQSTANETFAFAADRRRLYDNKPTKNFNQIGFQSQNNKVGYQGDRNGGKQMVGYKRNFNNLNCEHCKKSGHTIERCYKLHGYPADFTFNNQRRFANFVQGDNSRGDLDNGGHYQDENITATFTREQYTKLMSILDDSKEVAMPSSTAQMKADDNNTSGAYFAGSHLTPGNCSW